MKISEFKCLVLIASVISAITLVVLVGCTSSGQVGAVAGGGARLLADEGSPAFLDRASSQPTVSQNDAMRGILMLLNDKDIAATFQQRLDSLIARGIIPRRWNYDAGRAITRGRMAYMVYNACKIKGGVILQLTGPSQRYCLRELQYQGIMGPGTTYSKVTGMEYVAVLYRADEYLTEGKVSDVAKTGRGR